jgi:hypothetical protein
MSFISMQNYHSTMQGNFRNSPSIWMVSMMLVTIWMHKVQVCSSWAFDYFKLLICVVHVQICLTDRDYPIASGLTKSLKQTTHKVAILQWLGNLKIMELQNRPILWEPKYHEEDIFPYLHVHLQNSVSLTFSLHLSVKKAGIMWPNTYQCTIPWNLPWLHN